MCIVHAFVSLFKNPDFNIPFKSVAKLVFIQRDFMNAGKRGFTSPNLTCLCLGTDRTI